MSNPQASKPANRETGMIFGSIAEHLIPLFKAGATDTAHARRMAGNAIQAYQPETRADYINVARTVAFSIAALALLGKAASQDMTLPDQMKAFGRAIALNRSADQSERTMMQRRRYQQSRAPAEQPPHMSEPQASVTQIEEAEIEAAIGEAMREQAAARTPPKPNPPAPKPQASPVQPPTDAIRYNSQPQPAPYKAELLRNTAIQRIVAQSPAQSGSASSGAFKV
jgi:hypothetical protein